jgi:hypothetical protein
MEVWDDIGKRCLKIVKENIFQDEEVSFAYHLL